MEISKDLIKRCIKRDRKAQNELYRSHYNAMMSICWRYADSKDEAVEFLNAGFLKVIINLKKYKTGVPFDLWMRRVVINEVLDKLRKKKRYREKIEIREEEYLTVSNDDEVLTLDQEDKLEWIRNNTKKLPKMTAHVFNLYAFDGYKHKEIAQMLEISEGTSQWHFSVAKQKLKEWSTNYKNSLV